uniref:Uncharacterized protein n=1 Tax=Oryza nivara TaxID=4536 RepID=A0A0E0I1G6_ORYNI
MAFSAVQLPQCPRHCSFDVAKQRMARSASFTVLMHTKGDHGAAERWVMDRVVPLDKELERVLRAPLRDGSVFVLAVRDSYAYLATSPMFHDPQSPCWFLFLCLETMKLERLFRRTFDNDVQPYIMA